MRVMVFVTIGFVFYILFLSCQTKENEKELDTYFLPIGSMQRSKELSSDTKNIVLSLQNTDPLWSVSFQGESRVSNFDDLLRLSLEYDDEDEKEVGNYLIVHGMVEEQDIDDSSVGEEDSGDDLPVIEPMSPPGVEDQEVVKVHDEADFISQFILSYDTDKNRPLWLSAVVRNDEIRTDGDSEKRPSWSRIPSLDLGFPDIAKYNEDQSSEIARTQRFNSCVKSSEGRPSSILLSFKNFLGEIDSVFRDFTVKTSHKPWERETLLGYILAGKGMDYSLETLLGYEAKLSADPNSDSLYTFQLYDDIEIFKIPKEPSVRRAFVGESLKDFSEERTLADHYKECVWHQFQMFSEKGGLVNHCEPFNHINQYITVNKNKFRNEEIFSTESNMSHYALSACNLLATKGVDELRDSMWELLKEASFKHDKLLFFDVFKAHEESEFMDAMRDENHEESIQILNELAQTKELSTRRIQSKFIRVGDNIIIKDKSLFPSLWKLQSLGGEERKAKLVLNKSTLHNLLRDIPLKPSSYADSKLMRGHLVANAMRVQSPNKLKQKLTFQMLSTSINRAIFDSRTWGSCENEFKEAITQKNCNARFIVGTYGELSKVSLHDKTKELSARVYSIPQWMWGYIEFSSSVDGDKNYLCLAKQTNYKENDDWFPYSGANFEALFDKIERRQTIPEDLRESVKQLITNLKGQLPSHKASCSDQDG